MQSENLACEWNDVALLTDQRACTFLCKAMLCLPSPADGLVEGIQLKSWKGVSEPECQEELAGSVQLEVLYRDSKGESFIYSVELWLQGTIAEPVPFTGEACLLYSRGKAAGQHLLINGTCLYLCRNRCRQYTATGRPGFRKFQPFYHCKLSCNHLRRLQL